MIVFDKVREEFTPCPECQAIIEEAIREMEEPDPISRSPVHDLEFPNGMGPRES